ncbi:MAG: DinB family protein [Trueperaceae bacterium]
MGSDSGTVTTDTLRALLKSQYRAGFVMLRQAVTRFPTEAWLGDGHDNAPWQIAYHVLYYTHLYLQPKVEDFRAWPGHQADVEYEDGIPGEPVDGSDRPLIPEPYTKDQVLAYLTWCEERLGGWVDALDLTAHESGFPWYRLSKLEHQLINVRHLHHHMAQLADRMRTAAGEGVRWVSAVRPTESVVE